MAQDPRKEPPLTAPAGETPRPAPTPRRKPRSGGRMRTLFWVAVAVFLLDQATKYFVVHYLRLINERDGVIEVWPGFVEFRMAWNRGVNFGLFSDLDMRWVLIGVAVAISLGVVVWLWRAGGTRSTMWAAGLLVGGALGNVLDRVFYGAVADFLNVTCCGIQNPYAFNVADVAIFAGALGLAFAGEPEGKRPRRKKT